ncbi:N(4)-(beta-N-acetylglucosaminyl)-L-asparaginase [Acidaminobacter sp. JC074]|uniref:N(4)-(beta-N-acetylglucosaminyl)-L-asparaginase n=1 Tax=Acidaminobacter sp. JC074 TaxID=2530199 RepID=UPI001F0DB9F6|nr:N(4)-(beta-N-acetylglucosaminyl)-L-asparaginase [Acidaminobacter sp. JC074]MCH4886786.1 N(4)-(beta-N-acetylglucosaminyl)-L-asparaginase [Acidaminobacter sp. JC074]
MWGIIGTWAMVEEGILLGGRHLSENGSVMDAIEMAVKDVEKNEAYTSVGLGGLPNEAGQVELDAAFMDGKTLSVGAVAGIKDFLHPVSIARSLLDGVFNNFLIGPGAEKYAIENGFERYPMLTQKAKERWETHKLEVEGGLAPYIGHDTVCVVGIDSHKHMATCTSTSGLFYKKEGRVGDSPIPGSGYYVDESIGGAAATGLGEDIMKGCLSYEIVMKMKEMSPQAACEEAVKSFNDKLIERRGKAGDISVVAMNSEGEFGAATNIECFPFVVMTQTRGLMKFEVNQKGEIKSC